MLPDDEDHLAESLDMELTAAESEMGLNLTSWRIIDGYLRGARRFTTLDRYAGRVQTGYEHLRGDVLFRYEDIVRRYLVEVGRWLRSDISPKVGRRGESLGDMRNAAIANAVLNARVAGINLDRLKTALTVPFVKYGIVGIAHYEMPDPMHPDHVEVVPPRQLRFLPAFAEGCESIQGIARKRWMPYEWVRNHVQARWNINLDSLYDVESDLLGIRVGWGSQPPGHSLLTETMGGAYGRYLQDANVLTPANPRLGGGRIDVGIPLDSGRANELRDIDVQGRYYVPMEEIYPYMDDATYTARYILKIGRKIVYQDDYETVGRRIVCPLQAARYTDTGASFSRGFVAPLIPANDQFEKVIASVARNLRELDLFGTTYVSGNMHIDVKSLNKPGPRPKFEKYNVDPLAPNAQPFSIQPKNPGLLPVNFGVFLKQVTDSLAGQGPFYEGQAAGRDIGAAGHGFLFNTGNIGLGLPSANLADSMAAIYSRMLQSAREELREGETIKLATIDENLAGVVFNPETGSLELAQNPIPQPWEVKVDVKDRVPADPDVRKRELAEHHAAGLLGSTPEEAYLNYWLAVFEENLDVPGGPKDLYETWRKAIWQIILLFNDGKEPGPVEFDEHVQDPGVHLIALKRFMSKIEFSLASDEVQQEFVLWKEALERMTGTYPMGLPPPEDVAAEAMPEIEARLAAEQQQQGQQLAAGAVAPPTVPPGGVQVPVEGFV
ncbi:hypothetical protein AMJ85_00255 [candidate division BRC1 bacterium SM23_51]|nr:MAG: hypothetical protein AMJ85_00255 [candidate division BRC1 bacterium SM23_51]